MSVPPTYSDILAAARRLRGVSRLTPLLAGTALDDLTGGRILLKLEPLQVTGSFKVRGAYNALDSIEPARRSAGVVAFSSGNHAQGVAWAARRLGMPAAIVMPADAPRMKLDNTRALGAEVITYDRLTGSREAIAKELAESRGARLVPSFDDPQVIAGQGTAGLEIMNQAGELGLTPDQVLVCCSGGGLVSGCALAIREVTPHCQLYTVEPEGHDDARRSLASGRRERNPPGGSSLCDALLAPSPGELTFPIMHSLLAGGLAVSDHEVLTAMAWAWRELKLVVEPGGAVALAAVLAGRIDCRDRVTAVMISGGNVDPATFSAALALA
ncbi:MAG: threonine ammonia-lyase [Steroidobacteraceae bacterium]